MKKLLLFLASFLCAAPVVGQIQDPQWGLAPYQTFSGSDFDHINVHNGILNFSIPLWDYPQRGGRTPSSMKLQYNSQYYGLITTCDLADPSDCHTSIGRTRFSHVQYSIYTSANLRSTETAGFRFVSNDGAIVFPVGMYTLATAAGGLRGSRPTTATFEDYVLLTSDGASHPFNIVAGTGSGDGLSGGLGMSLDGTGYRGGNAGIIDRNGVGSEYYEPDGTEVNGIDPDGNGLGLVDTMGRYVPGIPEASATGDFSGCSPSATKVSVANAPGANGSALTYKFCYADVQAVIFGEPNNAENDVNQTLSLLQTIVLPNGQTWGFEYNAHGPDDPAGTNYAEVSKITLPSGSWISYQYADNLPATVVSRTVNDGTSSRTWTYNMFYSGTNDMTSSQYALIASVVDPDSNVTLTGFNDHGYEITSEVFQSGSSHWLRRTDTTYLPGVGPITPSEATGNYVNYLPDTVTTTLENGMVSKHVFHYCCDYTFTGFGMHSGPSSDEYGGTGTWTASYGIKSGEDDYDWGMGAPGLLLKSTHTDFLWQTNQNYLNANLLNTPTNVSILNAGGGAVSQTLYTYDEPGSVGIASGMTPSQQLFPPLNPGVYGHATTVTHVLTSGTGPTTHNTYYDTGELASTTDPRNNTTTFQYSSDYWDALPTSITNALGQTSTYTYDPNTAQKASVTDPNGNSTHWTFDNYGRLVRIKQPTNPWLGANPITSICYDDAAGQCQSDSPLNAIVVTEAITPTTNMVTEHRFDGLGRDIGTRLLSDPAGTTYTLKTYDDLGRTYQTWNPSRCALAPSTTSCPGESTFGITSHFYDALGRETLTVPPDGTTSANNVQTTYSGNQTTVTDQAGLSVTRTSDALGRLTQVMEAGNRETDYGYDAMGNLLSVQQHGQPGTTPAGFPSGYAETTRTRTFTYDELSRLVTSQNPETGTICYGTIGLIPVRDTIDPGPPPVLGPVYYEPICRPQYDGNGNLLAKTDANGTVIQYTYDPLNRLQTKSSSDAGNTAFSFTYDQGANGIGHLSSETNPNGTAGTQFSYDNMGRVTGTQWFQNSIQAWTAGMAAQYDLAGNLTQLTYPDGRVVTQSYDAANRLAEVDDATPGGTPTTYFGNAQYYPTGSLAVAAYGNGVTSMLGLNSRLQPCSEQATLAAPGPHGLSALIFNRQLFYSATPEANCGAATANNGNIMSVLEGPSLDTSQSFTYDNLNRLTGAFSTNRPAATTYNQSYNYDSFGNMLPNDHINLSPNYSIDQSTNRLLLNTSDYVYDAAGQLISTPGLTGPHAMSYTAEGYLRSIDSYSTGSYLYNGLGERTVAVHNNATWNQYVYLNGQPMADLDNTGTWTDSIYADGQRIARVANDPANGVSTKYYLADQLGTTQMELDSTGNILWQGAFTPFGQEIVNGVAPTYLGTQPADGTSNRYKFTGKERDNESGFDYFGARFYGSGISRFMSPDDGTDQDDYNPQSWNLYSYVRNSPLTGTDPDGRDCVTQIRTSSKTEQVSVNTGKCSGGSGNGTSQTFIPGTVTSYQLGADGHSLDIDSINPDGSTTVTNADTARIPENPGIALGYNQAGYNILRNTAGNVNYFGNIIFTAEMMGVPGLFGGTMPETFLGTGGVGAGIASRAGSGSTVLYEKLGPNGEHLKYGVTNNPATRYNAKELGGGRLKIIAQGSRTEMLALERELHSTMPIGPEEGQKFYVGQQVGKGLKAPPY